MNRKALLLSIAALGIMNGCCRQPETWESLNAEAAEEYLDPVRPASEGRNPCWNGFSKKFTYAPAFDVKAVDGASEYRFELALRPDALGNPQDGKWSFESSDPTADLSPIWAKIPPANVHLDILALDGRGEVIDTAYSRDFLRDFPFEGPYSSNVRPYREAAMMAALYVHKMPAVQNFKTSIEPDMSYDHFTYPDKIIGGLISLETKIAANVPHLRGEALEIARNAAAFLIRESRPEGDPLAYFPPTYYGQYVASKKAWNIGKMMTMDACMAGNAFLDLYDVTGDSLYFDRALKIADTYARIQRPDGSFPIKVWFETGEAVNQVGAMATPVMNYARRLENQYGVTAYNGMRDRAAVWMKAVALETFDLTGQFEDVNVEDVVPYQNLTNCTAAPYASFLLTSKDCSAADIEDARDLIRMSEDQFVHWNSLPNADGIRTIGAPCVFEQHRYQTPVDNSSCNVANAYLDLYELTGDKLAFAKAKALIDNLTVIQNVGSGQIPTTFDLRKPEKNAKRSFWINCTNASVTALLRMARITDDVETR